MTASEVSAPTASSPATEQLQNQAIAIERELW